MAATAPSMQGRVKGKRAPTRGRRRSIASWQSRPRAELVRFAIAADGAVRPDVAGRLGGRGLWLECRRAAIEAARAKGLFARVGRRAAVVPADLADRVEAEIERLVFATVGLAARAGRAWAAAEAKPDATGVVVSAPGAERPAGWKAAAVEVGSGRGLARAAGRNEVGAIWIEDGAFARRLLCLADRLKDWRGASAPPEKGV